MKNKINIAVRAAIVAGQEILKIYNDPWQIFFIKQKADHSPLTIADKKSHDVITAALAATGIPVLSEEGREIPYAERRLWESFWLVDPLDGTKEFIKHNDDFTVNIALITKGRPALGVIYIPVSKTLYVGIVGTWGWKLEHAEEDTTVEMLITKGTVLPVKEELQHYTIVGSRSHMNKETEEYISRLREEKGQVDFVSRGSSLKICMVAEGLANEYPRFGPTMEWDTAAGHAIANAAGKKILHTDLSGELQYNKENLLNSWFIVK